MLDRTGPSKMLSRLAVNRRRSNEYGLRRDGNLRQQVQDERCAEKSMTQSFEELESNWKRIAGNR